MASTNEIPDAVAAKRVAELASKLAVLVKDDADVEKLIAGLRLMEPEVVDEGDNDRLVEKAAQLFPANKAPHRKLTMVLCYREVVLYQLVLSKMTALGRGDSVRQGSITLGDIQWEMDDYDYSSEEGAKSPFGFVVERKSVADLAASIVDGRWKEQYGRTRDMGLHDVMMYVIDGNMHAAAHGAPFKSRLGSIIKKVARDKVRVAKTDSAQQTAEFLVYTHLYLEHIAESELRESGFSYGNCLKGGGKKREHMKEHKLERILLEMNGISPTIAQAITAKYPTVADLVNAYLRNPAGATTMLKNMVFITTGGHKRFIGPAISKEVASWFEVDKWDNLVHPGTNSNANDNDNDGMVTPKRQRTPSDPSKRKRLKVKEKQSEGPVVDKDYDDDALLNDALNDFEEKARQKDADHDDDDGYISDKEEHVPFSPIGHISLTHQSGSGSRANGNFARKWRTSGPARQQDITPRGPSSSKATRKMPWVGGGRVKKSKKGLLFSG